jgi:nicotinamidase/pyrazinamidase
MKALLIVDAVNGFCRPGFPLSLPISTAGMEQYIQDRVTATRNELGLVIFVCDGHSLSDPEIGAPYPPHCMTGTIESDVVDSLRAAAEANIVLKKTTLSSFLGTGLEQILASALPSEVEVTGVCTEICILFALYELRIRGLNAVVSRRGVLPLDCDRQDAWFDYFRDRLGVRVIA